MGVLLPKVSIVLATYNGAKYVRESIDSCLSQTYKNIELIILDDCSSDNTQEIIKGLSDNRLQYIRNGANLGLANSLNKGFSRSSGEYLTWTSYDNKYTNNAIEVMAATLKKCRDIDFVYTNFYRTDENGKITCKVKVKPISHLDIYNCVGYCFLYKRKVYEALGGYSARANLGEDYEYWLRIRNKFKIKRINKYLYFARYHPQCLRSKFPFEIETMRRKIRNEYIVTPWKKYYFEAEDYFLRGDKANCITFLKKSLLCNPFNLMAIRLLTIITIPNFLVKTIRKLKRLICRN